MSTQAHNTSILDLEPDTIIELYELDLGETDGIYRFHPGKNNKKNIMLTDESGVLQTYYPLPIQTDGFESKGDGSLPRPKILFANPNGVISDAIKNRNDLIGNFLVRKRIFLKFLDNENFPDNYNPFAIPDPESRFDDDTYIINRKVQENKFYVEFELISPLEFEDVKVPSRLMIANYCPWSYRGPGCLYGQRTDFDNQQVVMAGGSPLTAKQFFAKENTQQVNQGPNLGIPVADSNNKKFTSPEGYNLYLIWLQKYNNYTAQVQTTSAVTAFRVQINNSSGYDPGTGITVTVDALDYALSNGDIIFFNNKRSLLQVSGNVAASATSFTANLYGRSIVDNAIGEAPQTISIYSSTIDVPKDRSLVFENGATFRLASASLPSGSSTTSLKGYLSANLLQDELGDLKYVAGDVVSYPFKINNLSKIRPGFNTQDNNQNNSDRLFVCVDSVSPLLDPRYRIEWVMDDCSKDLVGCKCRYQDYGEYVKGLPFGGFPSIERYSFS